jgi:type I restriction enzyme, R subunit
MSELNYVELPVIRWLSGQGSTDPNETGLGWTYRDAAEMDSFDRPLEDPIVEKLLVEAIIRINLDVTTETLDKPDRLGSPDLSSRGGKANAQF